MYTEKSPFDKSKRGHRIGVWGSEIPGVILFLTRMGREKVKMNGYMGEEKKRQEGERERENQKGNGNVQETREINESERWEEGTAQYKT